MGLLSAASFDHDDSNRSDRATSTPTPGRAHVELVAGAYPSVTADGDAQQSRIHAQ